MEWWSSFIRQEEAARLRWIAYCFELDFYETGGSHLELFDPCQWLKSFTKIKSKTNARQIWRRLEVRNQDLTDLNSQTLWMKNKICFTWSQTISNNLSSDHGCFVSVLSNELAQYFVIKICSLVLFDQKMMARHWCLEIILSNFSNFVTVVFFYNSHHYLEFELLKILLRDEFPCRNSCPI